jgi:hypothetical protein
LDEVGLDLREDPRGREEYFITWAYLDSQGDRYKRQGIGRAALKFHHEMFDCPIFAQSDDSLTREDGSHLTGDAPAFVAKMREEGLIEPDDAYRDVDDDEEDGFGED